MRGWVRWTVAAVAVAAAFAGLFALGPREETLTVDEVMARPDRYLGERVKVSGTVLAADPANRTFVLGGGRDRLNVTHDGMTEVAAGESATVTGVLRATSGSYVLRAERIETGCPTKY